MKALLAFLFLFSLHAKMEDYFVKIDRKAKSHQLKGIDYIYLINLDKRPEKWQHSLSQLQPYGITPCRVPAVYGWALSIEALNDIALKFQPGMNGEEWASIYPPEKKGEADYLFLDENAYGKPCFARYFTRGAIGCFMSHLSVLQDAYTAGFETIWVMEDDVVVEKDPHLLSQMIEKMDKLVGKGNWDVLYTDSDLADKPLYAHINDLESDIKGDFWLEWRPDVPYYQSSDYAKRTIVSSDFLKIQSRMRTHSMIIRRSGIEKILNFEKTRGLFTAYDHEISLIPDIKLYSMRHNVVTFTILCTDTGENNFKKK